MRFLLAAVFLLTTVPFRAPCGGAGAGTAGIAGAAGTEAPAPVGADLSAELARFFAGNGFSVRTEPVAQTGDDEFARNIIITIPPAPHAPTDGADTDGRAEHSAKSTDTEKQAKKSTKSADSSDSEEGAGIDSDQKTTVIFDILQEDALREQDGVLAFVQHLAAGGYGYTAVVLLAALDSPLPGGTARTGTAQFAQSLDDPEQSAAVAVRLGGARNAVLPGARRSASPLWLSRRLVESFFDARIPVAYPHVLLSLYRLGLLRGDGRIEPFVQAEIPACAVTLTSADALAALAQFADAYTPRGTESWDIHYGFIPARPPLRPLWIDERVFVLACVLVGSLSVFLVCCLSFVGKSAARYKRDFLHSWYMIPLTLAVSFCALAAGQRAVQLVSAHFNPVVQFGGKIVVALVAISVVFAVQESLRIPAAPFVYGYVISLVALANIFIFSAIDIIFFVMFAAEYLIIYLARASKRIVWLAFWTAVMALPFAPYALTILRLCPPAELAAFSAANRAENFLLALGLFPFQIMWLRMLVRLNIFAGNRGYSFRRLFLNGTVATVSITVIALAGLLVVSRYFYKPAPRAGDGVRYSVAADDRGTLRASLSGREFLGITSYSLAISSDERPARYAVRVAGNGGVSVYDAMYEYETGSGGGTADFIIPDWPPQDITIDFAADSGAGAVITVAAFYPAGGNGAFRCELRTLSTGAAAADGRGAP